MFDFLYLSIAIVYAFLAIFVLKQKLETTDRKYFFFFLVSLLAWHLTLYLYLFIPLGDWLLFVGRLNYATGPLFTFGLLGFFYHFPKKTFKVSKNTEIAFWVWTIFLAVISLTTDLIDKNEVYVEDIGPVIELGEWILIYMVHMFAMPLLTLVLGIKKNFDLKGLAKTKFSFSYYIFIPTMLAFVITNGVLPLYHIFWQFVYSPIFLIPIAISSAIAMYRYRFFDLPLQALRLVRQVLLLSGYLIIGTGSYILLRNNILQEQVFLAFTIAATIGLFIWIKLNNWIPEFTSSEFRMFRHHLQNFQSSVYTTKSFEELLKNLETSFLLNLHFEKAELFLVRDKEVDIGIPIYKKDKRILELEKQHPEILVAEEALLRKNSHWTEFLKHLKADICIPLYLDNRVIGLLLLGKKSNNSPFSKEEINEILNTQTFLEICFINILLQGDLKEENNLMKKKIQEKTEKLQNQNQQIKKVLKQQSDFIAVTAHEFRTPLNVALFQLSDTLESFDHQSQVLEDMKTMETSLEKLKLLTQNLFDVQQFDLEKVSLQTEKTNIEKFTINIIQELKDLLKEKGIILTFLSELKNPIELHIDQTKLRQVMHNLISNASHFTESGETIEVELKEDSKNIQIDIIDHGPGVADEIKEDIFDKFRTAQASKGMGLGLGLYLCKKIMKLHQGIVNITDTKGGGATFSISLPKEEKS